MRTIFIICNIIKKKLRTFSLLLVDMFLILK